MAKIQPLVFRCGTSVYGCPDEGSEIEYVAKGECPNCGDKNKHLFGDDDANAMCENCWVSNMKDPHGHGNVCDGFSKQSLISHIKEIADEGGHDDIPKGDKLRNMQLGELTAIARRLKISR